MPVQLEERRRIGVGCRRRLAIVAEEVVFRDLTLSVLDGFDACVGKVSCALQFLGAIARAFVLAFVVRIELLVSVGLLEALGRASDGTVCRKRRDGTSGRAVVSAVSVLAEAFAVRATQTVLRAVVRTSTVLAIRSHVAILAHAHAIGALASAGAAQRTRRLFASVAREERLPVRSLVAYASS